MNRFTTYERWVFLKTIIKNDIENKLGISDGKIKVTAKIDRVFKAIVLNNLDILEAIISQSWGANRAYTQNIKK